MGGFDFNPLEVGNPMTLGMLEEEFVSKVDDMAWAAHAGRPVYSADIQRLLNEYHVDYLSLPQWIKDRIDTIDIVS